MEHTVAKRKSLLVVSKKRKPQRHVKAKLVLGYYVAKRWQYIAMNKGNGLTYLSGRPPAASAASAAGSSPSLSSLALLSTPSPIAERSLNKV